MSSSLAERQLSLVTQSTGRSGRTGRPGPSEQPGDAGRPVGETSPADFERAVRVTFLGRVCGRWRRSRGCAPATGATSSTSGRPQPVPPIYEPEIPAAFIVEAALDGRREKVVGVWNKLLVIGARLVPGIGNHYAAVAAWDSQLTQMPVSRDRPVNLRRPVDDTEDHGSNGIFDDKAGGMLDPSFLQSLPSTSAKVVKAAGDTWRETAAVWRRRLGKTA